LHVHPPLVVGYPEGPVYFREDLEVLLKKQEEAYLEGMVHRLRELAEVDVTCELLEGAIGDGIRAATVGTKADLVVMTTHGRGPLGRLWLGSVADELVRQLTTPLLLVRPTETPLDLKSDPVLKHILLPLDGSPLAEQMIEPAVALGSLMHADYTLLRVIKPVTPHTVLLREPELPPLAKSVLDRIEAIHEQLTTEARAYLEQVAERLRARSLRSKVKVAVAEQPGVAIIQQASPPATDLIALETHGRHGLARMILGSVADKVIRGAVVPVVVQHPAY
jgi:nucleotide-binding universal stress UspA family protein